MRYIKTYVLYRCIKLYQYQSIHSLVSCSFHSFFSPFSCCCCRRWFLHRRLDDGFTNVNDVDSKARFKETTKWNNTFQHFSILRKSLESGAEYISYINLQRHDCDISRIQGAFGSVSFALGCELAPLVQTMHTLHPKTRAIFAAYMCKYVHDSPIFYRISYKGSALPYI